METVIIGVLRAFSSSILISLMVFSLSRPKFGKSAMIALLVVFCFIDCVASLYFYLRNDLTALVWFDVLLFCVLGIAAKPLTKDTPLQWLFSYVTALNMFCAAVVASYLLSRLFPFPMLSNALIRIAMLSTLIFVFMRFLRPLHRQVVERWSIFFLLTFVVLMNFIYYFLKGGNIERSLIENAVPLLLVILTMVLIYCTVFAMLSGLSREYELRAKNARIEMHQNLLDSELAAAQDYVRFARQSRHDMRHHDAIVLECLAQGDIEEAQAYLNQHEQSMQESALRALCENQVANAVLRLYEQRCLDDGIDIAFQVALPLRLSLPSLVLGSLLSNILENAWKACRVEKASGGTACIVLVAKVDEHDRLIVELRNSASRPILFEEGMPLKENGVRGIGTQSVSDMVERYEGMVRFFQKDGMFFTQIIFSLPEDAAHATSQA